MSGLSIDQDAAKTKRLSNKFDTGLGYMEVAEVIHFRCYDHPGDLVTYRQGTNRVPRTVAEFIK